MLLLTFNTTFDLSFDNIFDSHLSSILVQYLSVEEIFCKLGMLSKNLNAIVNQLKSYKQLWVNKFIMEFTSNEGMKQLKSDMDLIGDDDHCKTYLVDHFHEYIVLFQDLK